MAHARYRPLAAAALLLAAAGCADAPPVAFHENPIGVLPQNSLSREWFVDLDLPRDGPQVTRLDVRDDLLFAYTADKRVVAVDRKSGVVKYTMAVDSPEETLQPVTQLNGFLVFANATSLQVFDDHGQFVKAVPVPTPIRSHVVAESNDAANANRGTTVYFGASGIGHGGLVEAYDITRTSAFKKWDYITHAQGAITAAPVCYGDVVYSGDDRGEVDAVSAQRLQVWDTDHGVFMTGGAITADLRADDYGLYVVSGDTKLSCISRNSGKLKWQYFAGAPLDQPPTITPDTVYLMTPNHGLVALDKTSGAYNRSPRWTNATAERFLAQDAKYTYVAASRPDPDPERPRQQYVLALDKRTGRPAFESAHHDFTVFGTNRRDNLVYVGFANGKLMALTPVLRAGQIGELVMVPVRPPAAVADAR